MKNITTLLLVFASLAGFSQKRELGEVTIEELKEKRHPLDTSAVAAVIFEKGKTYFDYKMGEGFDMATEVDVKIKIYKKEGYDWANKEISYYIGGQGDQSVMISKAVTYNLVDGKIEKTKLKSEGEFIEKSNKYWNTKKIQMPNVKEGSIIEYRYLLRSPYVSSSLPKWDFQKEIPVAFSEFKVNIPEYFNYGVFRKGAFPIVETKNKFDKKVAMASASSAVKANTSLRSANDFTYIDNQTIYKAENVPALRDESFVNNIANYTASVLHELQSIQYPQEPYRLFATDWDDVTKKIYENGDFGPQLNKNGYFEDDLKALLAGISDKNEKIGIIFNYVKSRMNWDKYNSYACDKGVVAAYKDKTGNSAEINLMLISMLRYAGIDASPIILSTRSNGIALYPSRTAFNYVIAGIEGVESITLLDATSKNALPNILPINDLNWVGRIIRKDGTSAQIDLASGILSKEITNVMGTLTATGEINGMVKKQQMDYNAFLFRERDGKLAQEAYLEDLEKDLNNSEVSSYVIDNKSDLSKPVVETYSFKNTNSAEVIGDKIFFSPLLFFSMAESPFKQEKREYPVDFVFPNQEKYLTIINMPEGYAVESMPEPISIVFTEQMLTYKFNISSNGKQIQATSVFDINTSVVAPEEYEELKNFFIAVIKKQTEKVVLKKA
ncbi:DUF3857 and transglutaminase domain-containing protein [Flavobacterium amniphilum]|uniref:DUF3857 domain-containing protein n=1 Tax=Flavobacterium amniphilum TaxID=1834035 RepID=UPI00202A896A|nr:DUF3857 domain-containing protein [Flavobacterium amniphilum]MCL9806723.1 DUF3857 and transglutaminase domain-containing protein [Flavobacterium amniphilum]